VEARREARYALAPVGPGLVSRPKEDRRRSLGACAEIDALFMTRASNFAVTAVVVTVIYLLLLLQIVPVPFIPASVTAEILPTVRGTCVHAETDAAAVVGAGEHRRIPVVAGRMGPVQLQRHSAGIQRAAAGVCAHELGLLQDIKEAKDFLHERGVTVD